MIQLEGERKRQRQVQQGGRVPEPRGELAEHRYAGLGPSIPERQLAAAQPFGDGELERVEEPLRVAPEELLLRVEHGHAERSQHRADEQPGSHRSCLPRTRPRSKHAPMKIVMMGSGGVGGYYGARLQQAGHEVAFVARGAHAEAMRKNGLRIRSELGDAQLSVRVLEDPAQAGPADLAVIAVKLWDTEDAARAVARVPRAAVVSLQNGVDKDEVLAGALGRDRVLGGVTHIGAVIAEPGVIAQTGKLQRITLGELDGSSTPRLQAIADAFRSAGVETVVSDDIRRVTWEKFVFLSALSGLTALTRKPIGEVRANPATRSLLLEALREAVAVARAAARAALAERRRGAPGGEARLARACSPGHPCGARPARRITCGDLGVHAMHFAWPTRAS